MSSWARAAAAFFLPSHCLLCQERALESFFRGGICDGCWNSIPYPADPRCELCDEPVTTADPALCGRCLLDPPEFRSLRSAAPYRGSARQLLLLLKFRGADYLAPHLARLLVARLAGGELAQEVAAVPARRLERIRRDHAAEILASAVARELHLPFAPGRLEKLRQTRRQSGLPLAQRAENVRGAFGARQGSPARILLIDDVATSGATARACARALRRSGAETVDVWCFARASREDEIEATQSEVRKSELRSPKSEVDDPTQDLGLRT
ncbi:MAG TPA: double zinc ribbon domain-containing protein [Thermoanaerobaculia bacterium]|nr:double zinc ribbon domain-containing protein [Thermoanaerobaculia bacterium]